MTPMEQVGLHPLCNFPIAHFSCLSAARQERLTVLAEECNEVGQVVCKTLRHGWDSEHPRIPGITNKDNLTTEIGDVLAAVWMLIDSGDLQLDAVVGAMGMKMLKANKYLHHNTFTPEQFDRAHALERLSRAT